MTTRRPPTRSAAQLAQRVAGLPSTRVSVCRIVSVAPLQVDVRGTVTDAVGVAGLTYTADPAEGPFTGVTFEPDTGLPIVLPRA
ncbi:hypothetical protein QT381_02520 [Galbitalea sp. SE-J8]|uniref:hypothetical protein n=1 Tax=Galbitalea sp. SE-J8 TaxID=3054952 RepID=UPI00259CDED3|nr:hypothetical protein [Galbitalea sp. SE-J8]MDM4761877.1 hypothetical protein [Galbitalea sp. SE-J8]